MQIKEEDIETKKELAEMRECINKLIVSVAEISTAIVGNVLTKDGGLAGRITILEKDNLELKNRILELDNKIIKSELEYKNALTLVKAFWATLTTIIMVIFGAIANHYFSKKDP